MVILQRGIRVICRDCSQDTEDGFMFRAQPTYSIEFPYIVAGELYYLCLACAEKNKDKFEWLE